MDLNTTIILEWVNIILGLSFMLLNMKRSIYIWPLNVLVSLIGIYTNYTRQEYSGSIISATGIFMSFYGWYNWKYNVKGKEKKKRITTTSWIEWLATAGFIALTIYPFYYFLGNVSSRYPWIGALSTSMVLAGLWLSAQKKLESTLFWGLYNTISIYKAYLVGSHYIYKYIVYLLLVPYTFSLWWKEYKSYTAMQNHEEKSPPPK